MRLILNAQRIEARRLRAGLLKRELARRAGLHANTITKAAAGRPVGVCAARQIAAALNLNMSALIVQVLEAPSVGASAAGGGHIERGRQTEAVAPAMAGESG